MNEWEGWVGSFCETMKILEDLELMEQLRASQADMAAGRFVTLDDLDKELEAKWQA